MDGIDCKASNYQGWFLEFNAGDDGLSGGYDIGLTNDFKPSGVTEGGAGLGSEGGSVALCWYKHWVTVYEECEDC